MKDALSLNVRARAEIEKMLEEARARGIEPRTLSSADLQSLMFAAYMRGHQSREQAVKCRG